MEAFFLFYGYQCGVYRSSFLHAFTIVRNVALSMEYLLKTLTWFSLGMHPEVIYIKMGSHDRSVFSFFLGTSIWIFIMTVVVEISTNCAREKPFFMHCLEGDQINKRPSKEILEELRNWRNVTTM